MQEQIDREAIAITVKASKLTGQVLLSVFRKVSSMIENAHHNAQTPTGRQPVKKLMNHKSATSTIPLDGDTKLFDRIARKFKVDYSFHKTGKDKFLLLFKSGQADAITAAFSEYSAKMMKRAQDRRPPIMERFRRAAERAAQQRPKNKERTRSREATRE